LTMMSIQAMAEYGVTTSSGASLGARLNGLAQGMSQEVGQLVNAAQRNPGMTTLVVAVLLIVMISWSLGSR
jgi:hypothetical protein